MIVDIHAHLTPPKDLVEPLLKGGGGHGARSARGGPGGITDKNVTRILSDPLARIGDMDALGIDMSVLTPGPPRGFYRQAPADGLAVERAVNDYAAEVVAAHPKRFASLGIVPLPDVKGAIAEMERVVRELGFKGVRVATNIDGMELDDAALDDFYAAAEDLGALIYTHPQGFTHPERLDAYYMSNAVGNPLESTLMIVRMVFAGIFERYPKLKVFVSHGGGFFPFYVGRFDQCFKERAECQEKVSRLPSSFLGQIYYDTVVFKPEYIAFLTQVAGVGQVMLGTDRPYDMGERDPVGLVNAVQGLSDTERAQIMGGTAAKLFELQE